MTYQIVIPTGNRICACGCGEMINELDKQGRTHRFKYGHVNKGHNHPPYGKHLTIEHKLRLSQSHKGLVPWNKGKKSQSYQARTIMVGKVIMSNIVHSWKK